MYKIYLLLPKPGLNSLRMLLNTVLSSEKAELWCRKPHICGFRKKFKPFGLDPPPPTSGHGTTVRFPLALASGAGGKLSEISSQRYKILPGGTVSARVK